MCSVGEWWLRPAKRNVPGLRLCTWCDPFEVQRWKDFRKSSTSSPRVPGGTGGTLRSIQWDGRKNGRGRHETRLLNE